MSRIVAQYDYTNAKGEPRIRKVRYDPKAFKMQSAYRWPDGPWQYTNGIADERVEWSTRALYRLPEVIAALRVDVPIWWCEGEKDVDSLAILGFTATSIWQGTSGLYVTQVEWLTRYRTQSDVIIVCDNDPPGGWFGWERYRTLTEVLEVEPRRITVIAPPVRIRSPLNDVTDAIEAGLRPSDFRQVDLDRLQVAAERYGAARAARYTQRRRTSQPPNPNDTGVTTVGHEM